MESSSESSDDDREVTANVYVNEAGLSQASPEKRFKARTKPETITESIDEEDRQSQFEGNPGSPTTQFSGSNATHSSGSSGFSRGSESLSRVSSASANGVVKNYPVASLANPSDGETIEIVRQVQKRLMCQGNVSENDFPEHSSPLFHPQGRGYIPVEDIMKKRYHGHGLATKSDLSFDDSNNESRYPSPRARRRRRCLVFIAIALILVGAILAAVFTVGKSETTASNVTGGQTGAPTTGTPTTSPKSFPTSVVNSEPTVIETAAPTKPRAARQRLFSISGDLIDDPTTPQYSAYQWLLNDDPANLDLDSLTDETLTQRYISALLYFSMDGDSWNTDCGFLQGTSVCEWNDEFAGKGIHCDPDGTIEAISISKSSIIMYAYLPSLLTPSCLYSR
jgi:hypothetical protein